MIVANCERHSIWKSRPVAHVYIHEESGTNLSEYQVCIDLDASNFQYWRRKPAIRIYQGLALRSYFSDYWDYINKQARIWVKVPNIPANSTIYLSIWASASPASNGETTFDFFDDFEGTSLDASKWAAYADDYSVSDSILRINKGGIEQAAPLPFNIQDGYVAETKVRHENTTGGYGGVLPEVASSPYTAPGNSNSDATVFYMRSDTGSERIYYWIGDGSADSYNIADGSYAGWSAITGTWYITGISILGGTVKLLRNGNVAITKTGISWAKNIKYIKLGSFHRNSSYEIHDTSYDWVRVRKFTSPEPSVTVVPV